MRHYLETWRQIHEDYWEELQEVLWGRSERKRRSVGFYHKPLGAVFTHGCEFSHLKTLKVKQWGSWLKKTYGETLALISHWGNGTHRHTVIPTGTATQKWGHANFWPLFRDVSGGQLLRSVFEGRLPTHSLALKPSPRHTSWGSLARVHWQVWTRLSASRCWWQPQTYTYRVYSSNRMPLSNKSEQTPATHSNSSKSDKCVAGKKKQTKKI